MIHPLFKGKRERTECSNYSLLIVVGKIDAEILVDKVCTVTEGLIDDEQGGVQSREGVCRLDFHSRPDR